MKNLDLNALLQIFIENTGNSIHKWIHYFDVYNNAFFKYRNKKVKMLEIGVQNGGSTRMWKEYFGPDVEIVCVDIDPACRELESEGFEVWIGDQASNDFWSRLKSKHKSFDIILDDGGHKMNQQIVTFEALFPILSDGGVYLCEDVHTSYFPSFGGGLKNKESFIEYAKNLVDEMHGWWYKPISVINGSEQYLMNNLKSVQFFDSIVVIEKKKKMQPISYSRGLEGHINNPVSITYHQMRRLLGVPD